MANPITSLIITSIAAPNAAMKMFAEGSAKNGYDFIVIGDVKSPAGFQLENCRFVSIDEQRKLLFKLAAILPEKHYARKNLGYLLAAGSDIIIETDDDNFPKVGFWQNRSMKVMAEPVEGAGWKNVYSLFSDEKTWPRGFPLEFLPAEEKPVTLPAVETECPIQQGLADENPDVDAVYRMCMKLPVTFRRRPSLALGKNAWCPFNSQNTTWFSQAFPLLYLPSYCSFRMTDIWRSFIAQRIAWECGWRVLFHHSTVWQERNEHSLLKDFEDEVPGYLNNAKIARLLEDVPLRRGTDHLPENLVACYSLLIENGIIGKEERPLLDAWLYDIDNARKQ